jgi:hypothetical protein
MLMCLGPVVFDAVVSNLTETDIDIDSSYAKHEVVGGEMRRNFSDRGGGL